MPTPEVEVWVATASPTLADSWIAAARGQLPRTLTATERDRRIVQLAVRRSVIAARLNLDLDEVEIAGGTTVPLSLVPSARLALSASHHDDVTVLALADVPAIGVDVEPLMEPGWDAALDEVLTPLELGALHRLPEHDRPAAYFTIWTLKEAVMKARAEGLGDRDPKSLELAPPPAPPALLAVDGAEPNQPWALTSVRFDKHVISVAVSGAPRIEFGLRHWPMDLPGRRC
jgi:4'-phosphopantetheinyl transferase